jgi:hypothetical protein
VAVTIPIATPKLQSGVGLGVGVGVLVGVGVGVLVDVGVGVGGNGQLPKSRVIDITLLVPLIVQPVSGKSVVVVFLGSPPYGQGFIVQ